MVNRLNLAALRANRLPRPPAQLSTLDQLREFFTQLRVSRRQFLKTAGFGGTATVPIVHALSSAACRFDMVGNEKRLAFLIDGVERWVIDPSQFSGKPRLSIKEAKQSIALKFENAFFPGTDFPSDFACEITRGGLSSKVRLRLGLAGFELQGHSRSGCRHPNRSYHE